MAYCRGMATTTYTDQELLDLVRAAIAGTLTREAAQITIEGRTLQSFSLSDLRLMENHYARKVARAAGSNRALVTRFRNPG